MSTAIWTAPAPAGNFPAVVELSSLNGTNGFTLDGATNSGSGSSVAGAGDVNGDGIADMIIGAPFYPNGIGSGSTYVVFGSASGFLKHINLSRLNGTNGFRIDGVAAGDQSGESVAGAGDVNGDGIKDVIITDSVGSAYVLFGSASGFPKTIGLSGLNGTNGFRLDCGGGGYCASAASAGDVNHDGISDVIIGSITSAITSANASYVLFGSASGFPKTIKLSGLNGTNGFRIVCETAGDGCGISVAGAGDVNDDGIADMMIGAPTAQPNGLEKSGSSYVVFGSASGFPGTVKLSQLNGTNGFRLDGVSKNDGSGNSVAGAGDVNNDGIADIVIGAPGRHRLTGAVFVVFGRASGFPAKFALSRLNGSNGFRIQGVARGTLAGRCVAGARDINDDHIADVIIGAFGASPNGIFAAGSSYVVFGRASGFAATIALADLDGKNGFRLDGDEKFGSSGYSVADAGDVNHDGVADVIIGAPQARPNGSDSGQSYLVFGRP